MHELSPHPIGSDKPEVYLINSAPKKYGSKITGDNESDEVLLNALTRANVSNYRFCNLITTPSEDKPYSAKELREKSALVLIDIKKVAPRLILVLGQAASTVFIESKKSMGEIAEGSYKYEGIPLKVIYHPSYIVRKGGKNTPAFDDYISQINVAVHGGTKTGKGNYSIKWKLVDTHKKWLKAKKHLSKFRELAYDTETNGLMKYSKDNRIIGIGIASPKKAYYIIPQAFEDEKLTEVVEFLLSVKTVLVYNAPFEHGVLHSEYKVRFENFFDVAMLARMRGIVTPLKKLAQWKLGVTNWSDKVSTINNFIHLILAKVMTRSSRKVKVKSFEWLQDSWSSFIENESNEEIIETYYEIKSLLEKGELKELRKGILNAASSGEWKSTFYELIPKKIVGQYCCIDAHSLFALRKILLGEMDSKEEKSIEYYHDQTLLACELERNSVIWDDDKAKQISKTYLGLLLMSLKGLILSNRVSKFLHLTLKEKEDILVSNDLDYLKKTYLNPFSSAKTCDSLKVLNQAIRTRAIKMATAIHELSAQPKVFPTFDKFYSLHKSKKYQKKITQQFEKKRPKSENKKLSDQELTEKLTNKVQLSNTVKAFEYLLKYDGTKQIDNNTQELIDEVLREENVSFADEPVSAMLNALPYMGVDIIDANTWERFPEATTLLLLRYFKKVFKGKSTYIDGNKVGRGRVWVGKRDKDNNTIIREKEYEPDKNLYIYQTDFFSNSAETRRWRSGFHTIPAFCELRDIQVSRYNHGFITHTDYSQMEIRILAHVSQCKALLKEFEDENVDVHRSIASKMMKKKASSISKAERRYGKTGTFSILYGATPFRVAMTHMKGNVEAAEKMFEEFFEAFPEIKIWIEKTHLHLLKYGYVRTMFGDKLYVPIPTTGIKTLDEVDDLDKETKSLVRRALRQAQNWPIQNASSGVTGWSCWQNVKAIRKHNLRVCSFNFQHDSQDNDAHGKDVFKSLYLSKKTMETLPRERFGIPVKIDMELGVRNNSAGGVKNLLLSKDGKEVEFDFEIRGDAVDEIINHIEYHWKIRKMNLTSEEPDPLPFSELFLARRAFSTDIGKEIVKRKYHIELESK